MSSFLLSGDILIGSGMTELDLQSSSSDVKSRCSFIGLQRSGDSVLQLLEEGGPKIISVSPELLLPVRLLDKERKRHGLSSQQMGSGFR